MQRTLLVLLSTLALLGTAAASASAQLGGLKSLGEGQAACGPYTTCEKVADAKASEARTLKIVGFGLVGVLFFGVCAWLYISSASKSATGPGERRETLASRASPPSENAAADERLQHLLAGLYGGALTWDEVEAARRTLPAPHRARVTAALTDALWRERNAEEITAEEFAARRKLLG